MPKRNDLLFQRQTQRLLSRRERSTSQHLRRSQLTVSAIRSRILTTATYHHRHPYRCRDRIMVLGPRRWGSIAWRLRRQEATGSPRCNFGVLIRGFATRREQTGSPPICWKLDTRSTCCLRMYREMWPSNRRSTSSWGDRHSRCSCRVLCYLLHLSRTS